MDPLIVMGAPDEHLQVRAYVDEILIDRMADPAKLSAEMFIRGTDKHVPLTFVRMQPYVSPKIELSDERQELVDVRVLPVIFRLRTRRASTCIPGNWSMCMSARNRRPASRCALLRAARA